MYKGELLLLLFHLTEIIFHKLKNKQQILISAVKIMDLSEENWPLSVGIYSLNSQI